MLRRDFMLKLIEQFAKMVAQLLDLDFVEESQQFSDDFDALLNDYFKINDLKLLLETDEARDALLLDERSKNSQLSLFARAGLVYFQNAEKEKAEICLKIVDRIKERHSGLYEFPSAESQKIDSEIQRLRDLLN